MKRIINGLFSFLKYVLLILAFGLTLFIILRMYTRLSKTLNDAVFVFLPYAILLLLFILNICLKREAVTKNIFFNITASLVFSVNIFVCLRAILDRNMLFNVIQKMDVNSNYFDNYLSFNQIMLYGLILADIIFMFVPNTKKKKVSSSYQSEVAKKIEVDQEVI